MEVVEFMHKWLYSGRLHEYRVESVSLCGGRDYEGAIKLCNKGLKKDPKDSRFYNTKGNAYRGMKRYDESLKEYDNALKFNPNWDEAYRNKALSFEGLGKYIEAIEQYDKAIKSNAIASDHGNKAALLCKLGRHENAVQEYEKAIGLKKSSSEYYIGKAESLIALGKCEEAIQEYDKSINFNSKYEKMCYYHKGMLLKQKTRHKDAVECFDMFIKRKNDYMDAYYHRAVSLIEIQRYDDAIKDLEFVLQKTSNHVDALTCKGIAVFGLAKCKYEESIKIFDKALDIKRDSVDAYCNKGISLFALGKYLEANEEYQKCLNIKPDHYLALKGRNECMVFVDAQNKADNQNKYLIPQPTLIPTIGFNGIENATLHPPTAPPIYPYPYYEPPQQQQPPKFEININASHGPLYGPPQPSSSGYGFTHQSTVNPILPFNTMMPTLHHRWAN